MTGLDGMQARQTGAGGGIAVRMVIGVLHVAVGIWLGCDRSPPEARSGQTAAALAACLPA